MHRLADCNEQWTRNRSTKKAKVHQPGRQSNNNNRKKNENSHWMWTHVELSWTRYKMIAPTVRKAQKGPCLVKTRHDPHPAYKMTEPDPWFEHKNVVPATRIHALIQSIPYIYVRLTHFIEADVVRFLCWMLLDAWWCFLMVFAQILLNVCQIGPKYESPSSRATKKPSRERMSWELDAAMSNDIPVKPCRTKVLATLCDLENRSKQNKPRGFCHDWPKLHDSVKSRASIPNMFKSFQLLSCVISNASDSISDTISDQENRKPIAWQLKNNAHLARHSSGEHRTTWAHLCWLWCHPNWPPHAQETPGAPRPTPTMCSPLRQSQSSQRTATITTNILSPKKCK